MNYGKSSIVRSWCLLLLVFLSSSSGLRAGSVLVRVNNNAGVSIKFRFKYTVNFGTPTEYTSADNIVGTGGAYIGSLSCGALDSSQVTVETLAWGSFAGGWSDGPKTATTTQQAVFDIGFEGPPQMPDIWSIGGNIKNDSPYLRKYRIKDDSTGATIAEFELGPGEERELSFNFDSKRQLSITRVDYDTEGNVKFLAGAIIGADDPSWKVNDPFNPTIVPLPIGSGTADNNDSSNPSSLPLKLNPQLAEGFALESTLQTVGNGIYNATVQGNNAVIGAINSTKAPLNSIGAGVNALGTKIDTMNAGHGTKLDNINASVGGVASRIDSMKSELKAEVTKVWQEANAKMDQLKTGVSEVKDKISEGNESFNDFKNQWKQTNQLHGANLDKVGKNAQEYQDNKAAYQAAGGSSAGQTAGATAGENNYNAIMQSSLGTMGQGLGGDKGFHNPGLSAVYDLSLGKGAPANLDMNPLNSDLWTTIKPPIQQICTWVWYVIYALACWKLTEKAISECFVTQAQRANTEVPFVNSGVALLMATIAVASICVVPGLLIAHLNSNGTFTALTQSVCDFRAFSPWVRIGTFMASELFCLVLAMSLFVSWWIYRVSVYATAIKIRIVLRYLVG